jgi:hypothetical protein
MTQKSDKQIVGKRQYKQIHCNVCGKQYGVNYYYAHKKSKAHIRKANRPLVKEELLKDDTTDQGDDASILLDKIISLIDQLKEKLE